MKLMEGFFPDSFNQLATDKIENIKKQLAAMQFLTPGDFATVRRKLTVISEVENMELFLTELQEEVNFKNESSKRSIGFSAAL